MIETSFGNWLRTEVQVILNRPSNGGHAPLLIWCDPERVWKDLLISAAKNGGFELWADDQHELELRERFCTTPAAPRVVWLPVARENLTYFKVFELVASDVREWTLARALALYGVEISPQHLPELEPLLKAHVKEWFDRPRSAWDELTPGNAQGTLVDDELVFEYVTTPGLAFEKLQQEDRFSIFADRLVDDFGLPAPKATDAEGWRTAALASLLCTDAAAKTAGNPPNEPQRIILAGPQRDRALRLLARWQKQVDLVEGFESLVPKADQLTALQFWARGLEKLPAALASRVVENTLFEREMERLAAIDSFDTLAESLDSCLRQYRIHAAGFWGKQAKNRLDWVSLVKLGEVACLLRQENKSETAWKRASEAVEWYTRSGWCVDQAGELLFQDHQKLPGALVGVAAKLRKAYVRHFDAVNSRFAELVEHDGLKTLGLPFAGESIRETTLAAGKEPVAVLVLDAFRYDLGERLAVRLNRGEPSRRAQVKAAIAPLPSITALGMAFALPGCGNNLKVDYEDSDKPGWKVTAPGFAGNLSVAGERREWLKQNLKVKDKSFLTIDQVADAGVGEEISTKTHGKLVFVFGDEVDDHDCVLKPYGLDQTLDRYATVARRLRKGGFGTILVVTDHGFFHWDPDPDEKDLAKPGGEILFSSRRAIAGRHLKHASTLKFTVPASDLDCCVPRSIGAFKTYGGLGFFHGGATLEELVIPVVTIRWPKKARKAGVLLKPVSQITSLAQHVEVASAEQQQDFLSESDENVIGRQVVVKVVDPATGKNLFKSKQSVNIEPTGKIQVVEIAKIEGAEGASGMNLTMVLEDADDGEQLDRRPVTLKIDLDEWI